MMKKIYLLTVILIGLSGIANAQHNCPFNVSFETQDATCFNNGKLLFVIYDENNQEIDAATLVSTTDIMQVRGYWKHNDGADTNHYAPDNVNVMTVEPGEYIVGVQAVCGDSIILDRHQAVTVGSTYVIPSASPLTNFASSKAGYGNRYSTRCADLGRIQLKIEGGVMPYTIVMVNAQTGDTLSTKVFTAPMYAGGDSTQYNFHKYYTYDSLAIGSYHFYMSDACGYGLPRIAETVHKLPQPTVSSTFQHVSGVNSNATENNVDNGFFPSDTVFQMRMYVDNLLPYLSDVYRDALSYKITYPSASGLTATNWKSFPYSTGQNWAVVSDTIHSGSFNSVFGGKITLSIRLECGETLTHNREFSFEKPSGGTFDTRKSEVFDSVAAVHPPCASEYYMHTDWYSIQYKDSWIRPINERKPIVWIYTNTGTNEVIKRDTLSTNNINARSYLKAEDIERYYGVFDSLHQYPMKVERKLVNGNGAVLYSRTDSLKFIVGKGVEQVEWEAVKSVGSGNCGANSSITLQEKYAATTNQNQNVIRLVKSPYNNYFNFTATYDSVSGRWKVEPEDLQDITGMEVFKSTGPRKLYVRGNLPSGPYWFDVETQCGTYHVKQSLTFNDQYDVRLTQEFKYTTVQHCSDLYLKPQQGHFSLYRINGNATTGERREWVDGSNIYRGFQIINGPRGGYETRSINTNSHDSLRITMPGTYVIRMGTNNTWCGETAYQLDTITFVNKMIDFDYARAILCNAGDDHGSVHVQGKNGTAPFTYTLYSGPDLTGVQLGSNTTGEFENVPFTMDSVLSCQVRDNCGAFFSVDITPSQRENIKGAWFEGLKLKDTKCEGDSVTLHAFKEGHFDYSWTGPNGFTCTSADTTFALKRNDQGGWYKVSIQMGCPVPITDSIQLAVLRSPTLAIAKDTTICPGMEVALQLTPSSDSTNALINYKVAVNENGTLQVYSLSTQCDSTAELRINPMYPTKVYSALIDDGTCVYKIADDTVTVITRTDVISACDIVAEGDRVCYNTEAEVKAKSTLTVPYVLKWYGDYELTDLLQTDSMQTTDWSVYNMDHVKDNRTLYVAVEKDGMCPYVNGIPSSTVLMSDGMSTHVGCDKTLRFFDEGGAAGNYVVHAGQRITHTFECDPGYKITLNFDDLDIASTASLKIYSGAAVDADSIIRTLRQGADLSKAFTSKGNSMTVEFITGGGYAMRGWDARVGVAAVADIDVIFRAPQLVLSTTNDTVCYDNTAHLTASSDLNHPQYFEWWDSKLSNVLLRDTIQTAGEVSHFRPEHQIKDSLYYINVYDADNCPLDTTYFNVHRILRPQVLMNSTNATNIRTTVLQPYDSVPFYDMGGKNSNVTTNNTWYYETFTAEQGQIVLHLDTLQVVNDVNYPFKVLDGKSSSSEALATLYGNKGHLTYRSSTGSLTIAFRSRNSYRGWEAYVTTDRAYADLSKAEVKIRKPNGSNGVVTTPDTVCYDNTAHLMATSSLNYPQYFQWWSSDKQTLLLQDTVQSGDVSHYYTSRQKRDQKYYVSVYNDESCPMDLRYYGLGKVLKSEFKWEFPSSSTTYRDTIYVGINDSIPFFDEGGFYGGSSRMTTSYGHLLIEAPEGMHVILHFDTINLLSYRGITIYDDKTQNYQKQIANLVENVGDTTFESTGRYLYLYHQPSGQTYSGWKGYITTEFPNIELREANARIRRPLADNMPVTTHDTICYDQTAHLTASIGTDKVNVPQYFTWWNDLQTKVLQRDTLTGTNEYSYFNPEHQTKNTDYYVTVHTDGQCPYSKEQRFLDFTVLPELWLKNGTTPAAAMHYELHPGEIIPFYDISGPNDTISASGTARITCNAVFHAPEGYRIVLHIDTMSMPITSNVLQSGLNIFDTNALDYGRKIASLYGNISDTTIVTNSEYMLARISYYYSIGSMGWSGYVTTDKAVDNIAQATVSIRKPLDASYLVATNDTVCYDNTAVLTALSDIGYPQYYTWWKDDGYTLLYSDTVHNASEQALWTPEHQIKDSLYFVHVYNDTTCPFRADGYHGLVLKERETLMNTKTVDTVFVTYGERIYFYDNGGKYGNTRTNDTLYKLFIAEPGKQVLIHIDTMRASSLTFFDGTSQDGKLIQTLGTSVYTNYTYRSTSGAIFVRWYASPGVYGWSGYVELLGTEPIDLAESRVKIREPLKADTIIATNDTVCYDQAAVLTATSSIDYPQYYVWWGMPGYDVDNFIHRDTVHNATEHSQYIAEHQVGHTEYYVHVWNDRNCPLVKDKYYIYNYAQRAYVDIKTPMDASSVITTTYDTVCYDNTAVLTAVSSSDVYPQFFSWWKDDAQTLLHRDTVYNASEHSEFVAAHQVSDSLYYVVVEDTNNCPFRPDFYREKPVQKPAISVYEVPDSTVIYLQHGDVVPLRNYATSVDSVERTIIFHTHGYERLELHINRLYNANTPDVRKYFGIYKTIEEIEDYNNIIVWDELYGDYNTWWSDRGDGPYYINSSWNRGFLTMTGEPSVDDVWDAYITTSMDYNNSGYGHMGTFNMAKARVSIRKPMGATAVTATNDAVCYDNTATLTATSPNDVYPQYFSWWKNDGQTLLHRDTVHNNSEHSTFMPEHQISDSLYYVAVGNDNTCPFRPDVFRVKRVAQPEISFFGVPRDTVIRVHVGDSIPLRNHVSPTGGTAYNCFYFEADKGQHLIIHVDSVYIPGYLGWPGSYFAEIVEVRETGMIGNGDGINIESKECHDNPCGEMECWYSGGPPDFYFDAERVRVTMGPESPNAVFVGYVISSGDLLDVAESRVEIREPAKNAVVTHDQVCYDQTATLTASSSLGYPQYYSWWNKNLDSLLLCDTVFTAGEYSTFHPTHQIQDSIYYVTVYDDNTCPYIPGQNTYRKPRQAEVMMNDCSNSSYWAEVSVGDTIPFQIWHTNKYGSSNYDLNFAKIDDNDGQFQLVLHLDTVRFVSEHCGGYYYRIEGNGYGNREIVCESGNCDMSNQDIIFDYDRIYSNENLRMSFDTHGDSMWVKGYVTTTLRKFDIAKVTIREPVKGLNNAITTHDTVCYDHTATLTASSSSYNYPQYYNWWNKGMDSLLLRDTVFASGDVSTWMPTHQIRDSLYYVVVYDDNSCPYVPGQFSPRKAEVLINECTNSWYETEIRAGDTIPFQIWHTNKNGNFFGTYSLRFDKRDDYDEQFRLVLHLDTVRFVEHGRYRFESNGYSYQVKECDGSNTTCDVSNQDIIFDNDRITSYETLNMSFETGGDSMWVKGYITTTIKNYDMATVTIRLPERGVKAITTNDTVCYDNTATLTAFSSTLTYPQYYNWWNKSLDSLLLRDTVLAAGDVSIWMPTHQTQDSLYYVTVYDQNTCPIVPSEHIFADPTPLKPKVVLDNNNDRLDIDIEDGDIIPFQIAGSDRSFELHFNNYVDGKQMVLHLDTIRGLSGDGGSFSYEIYNDDEHGWTRLAECSVSSEDSCVSGESEQVVPYNRRLDLNFRAWGYTASVLVKGYVKLQQDPYEMAESHVKVIPVPATVTTTDVTFCPNAADTLLTAVFTDVTPTYTAVWMSEGDTLAVHKDIPDTQLTDTLHYTAPAGTLCGDTRKYHVICVASTGCETVGDTSLITYAVTEGFTVPSGKDSVVACLAKALAPAASLLPTVTDGCGNVLTPTGPVSADSIPTSCEGKRTYTYTYTDCALRSHEWTYTYWIRMPEKLSGIPANDTLTVDYVSQAVAPGAPDITDECGRTISPTYDPATDSVSTIGADGTGTIEHTYTYTDCAGHDSTYTRVYRLSTISTPLRIASGDCTLEYNGLEQTCEVYTVTFGGVTVDECMACRTRGGYTHRYILPATGDTVTIKDAIVVRDVVTDTANTYTAVIGHASRYTDVKLDTGRITITPLAIGITAADSTKECDGTALTCDRWSLTSGTLGDGDAITSVTVTGSQDGVGTSPNKASDAKIEKGTEDVTHNYTITYNDGHLTVTDTTKPTFTSPKDTTLYKDALCNADTTASSIGSPTNLADNCADASALTVTHTDGNYSSTCAGSYTFERVWRVTDATGNYRETKQTVTVSDTVRPVYERPKDTTVYKNGLCAADTTPAMTGQPTGVTDNCSGASELTIVHYDRNITETCAGSYTFERVWRVVDECGNVSAVADSVQTVTVSDTTRPEFDVPADTVICREVATDMVVNPDKAVTGEPTAHADNCTDAAVLQTNTAYTDVDPSTVDHNIVNYIERHWTVEDACGNVTEKVQRIGVFPAIHDGNTPMQCHDTLLTLAYGRCDTAIDLRQPTWSTSVTGAGTIRLSNDAPARFPEGATVVTWTLTDTCGFTVTCQQTVTVSYPPCGRPQDTVLYDGFTYHTVRVGCECWLQENLRNRVYSDGTDVAVYSSYEHSDQNEEDYGLLYTWYSAVRVPEGDNTAVPADSVAPMGEHYVEGACPAGWAVPTDAQYEDLWLNGYGASGLKDKDARYWLPGYAGTDPNSYFNARGAGYYDPVTDRYYNLLGETYFWTGEPTTNYTEGHCAVITSECPELLSKEQPKGRGQSIRCVQKR